MERKRLTCSAGACQHLYVMMNKRSETVRLKRSLLDEVIACHRSHGVEPPLALTGLNREVSRQALFDFVQDHGEICGKQKVDENWIPERVVRRERIAARRLKMETKALQKRNEKTRGRKRRTLT